MGVDTKGAMSEKVTGWDVYDFIKQNIDPNAEQYLRTNYGREQGSIIFKHGEEDRQIFFCVTQDPIYGIDESRVNKYAHLILGYWGSSVEIMEKIVSNFGGYVDANDCDDENYYEVGQIKDSEFEEYSRKKNLILEILSDNFTKTDKNRIARELIDNKENIMKVLGGF